MNSNLFKIVLLNFEKHKIKHLKNQKNSTILKAFLSLRNTCKYCSEVCDLRKCLCGINFCLECIKTKPRDPKCIQECYIFMDDNNSTKQIFNLSKHKMPKNFEATIRYNEISWARFGICYDVSIKECQIDSNDPKYNVYYILEDLKQFYDKKNWWKTYSTTETEGLNKGDYLTIIFKNGKIRFLRNYVDIGFDYEISFADQSYEPYLLVHTRNEKSEAEIIYMCGYED
jgi:hypothetical protein